MSGDIHESASLAAQLARVEELERRAAEDAKLIEVLRAHVDDGTEECSICRGVLRAYDERRK